jgi:hypothetical protein
MRRHTQPMTSAYSVDYHDPFRGRFPETLLHLTCKKVASEAREHPRWAPIAGTACQHVCRIPTVLIS